MTISVIECPHCRKINEDNTFSCECGEIIARVAPVLYDESEKKIINGSREHLEKVRKEKDQKLLNERVQEAKRTGNYQNLPFDVADNLNSSLVLTTSMFVAQHEIEGEIEVITAECAYGMNILRDLFAGVVDIVGGRSKAVEKVLSDGRRSAMAELRHKAFMLGAQAVVGVDLDYIELSGGGKNGMLVVVATGTAVKLKEPELASATQLGNKL